jgi:hypothetical protein
VFEIWLLMTKAPKEVAKVMKCKIADHANPAMHSMRAKLNQMYDNNGVQFLHFVIQNLPARSVAKNNQRFHATMYLHAKGLSKRGLSLACSSGLSLSYSVFRRRRLELLRQSTNNARYSKLTISNVCYFFQILIFRNKMEY